MKKRLSILTLAMSCGIALAAPPENYPASRYIDLYRNSPFTDPPVVRVRVGPPVKLKGKSLDADTKRIMKAIVAQLPDEAREQRTPTRDELLATFPPGYSGDPEQEYTRRPGED